VILPGTSGITIGRWVGQRPADQAVERLGRLIRIGHPGPGRPPG